MASQESLDKCYMQVAEAHACLSKSKRKSVGCCIVTKNGVMLGGVNGMAPGNKEPMEYTEYLSQELVTKAEVIHGELNAILKAAKEGVSVVGGTLYTTLSCCKPCSEMVAAAGIVRVVYKEAYRDTSGIENLKKLNLRVDYYQEE